MAVTSLNVEPGAYWPWMARLMNGSLLVVAVELVVAVAAMMPLTNSAGS